MLGTGKVAAVTDKTNPEDILRIFYRIKDTSTWTVNNRVKELFAKSGSDNRRVLSAKEIEEGVNNNDNIVDSLNESMTRPYIIRACQIISRFIDPFKRKCTAGMFMASGTTLRFPAEFKLSIDTDDPIVNAENEEINELVEGFKDKISQEYEEAVLNFYAYMENNFPPEVRDEFIVKSGDYFTQPDISSNVKRALVKAYRNINQTLSDETFNGFKEVLQQYRAMTRAINKPDKDRVSDYLGIDKKTMMNKGNDGLKLILDAMPDKVMSSLINGV